MRPIPDELQPGAGRVSSEAPSTWGRAGLFPAVGLILLGIMLGSAGSLVYESRERKRVDRLERRLDSFALTLTQVVRYLDAAAGAAAEPESLTVGALGAGNLGAAGAPVTIVEFTDYQCPFCARHALETWPELRARYVETGQVRYVVRALPLPNHSYARAAASSAHCAAQQSPDAFWHLHEGMFAAQARLADSVVHRLVREAGLDSAAFRRCLDAPATARAIDADVAEAQAVGLNGTPGFVVGRTTDTQIQGEAIRGAFPFEEFDRAVRAAMAVAANEPLPRPLNSGKEES